MISTSIRILSPQLITREGGKADGDDLQFLFGEQPQAPLPTGHPRLTSRPRSAGAAGCTLQPTAQTSMARLQRGPRSATALPRPHEAWRGLASGRLTQMFENKRPALGVSCRAAASPVLTVPLQTPNFHPLPSTPPRLVSLGLFPLSFQCSPASRHFAPPPMAPSILLDQAIQGFASSALKGSRGRLCWLPEAGGGLALQPAWGDRGQCCCLAPGAG